MLIILTIGQAAAICVITCASIALAYVLGLDEGRIRGRVEGRRLAQEAREKARQQVAEEAWFSGGRHRS